MDLVVPVRRTKRDRAAGSRRWADNAQRAAPLLTWLAALLISCSLAWVLSSAVSAAAAVADERQLASARCSVGGSGLLYVGLNSWIPASTCNQRGQCPGVMLGAEAGTMEHVGCGSPTASN
jgi:hypothetical protein